MPNEEKYELIADIYKSVYYNVSSYYADSIGIDLAYMTTAIIIGGICELHPNSTLTKLLQAEFAPSHILWKSVYVEPLVRCASCKNDIPLSDASYYIGIQGWLGQWCCVDDGTTDTTDEYYFEMIAE